MLTSQTDRRTLPGTTSMPGAPEAFSRPGGASEAFLDPAVLIRAACAQPGADRIEWVPDVERDLVPEPLRALCLSCPGRAGCLRSAIVTRSQGYWAGTTTTDRQRLVDEGAVGVTRADQLQAAAAAKARQDAAADQARALHPVGQDSLWWYRHGRCRCGPCRGHNAQRRSEERARQRQQTACSAAA